MSVPFSNLSEGPMSWDLPCTEAKLTAVRNLDLSEKAQAYFGYSGQKPQCRGPFSSTEAPRSHKAGGTYHMEARGFPSCGER